ncbi:hypothetical protein DSO57_1019105 [Entomophthora muscae]|uniref:Uncharacterized protein n=1 Tax=Entomophthora muscae TaxID=34485 RepID=A0ACC2UDP9_9FUNG|nr:hypothetical protein DSO57_1019105 [Entomophthora muscae]
MLAKWGKELEAIQDVITVISSFGKDTTQVEVSIQKVKIKAILDTGSPVNTVTSKQMKKLKLAPDLNYTQSYRTAGRVSHLCDLKLNPNNESLLTNKETVSCSLGPKPKYLETASLQVIGPKPGTASLQIIEIEPGTNLILEKSLILANEALTTCKLCLDKDPPNLTVSP